MFNEAVFLNKAQACGLCIWPVVRPVNSQFQFRDRPFGWPELSLLKRPLCRGAWASTAQIGWTLPHRPQGCCPSGRMVPARTRLSWRSQEWRASFG